MRCSGWPVLSIALCRRKSGQCMVCGEWSSDVQPAGARRTSPGRYAQEVEEEREKNSLKKIV